MTLSPSRREFVRTAVLATAALGAGSLLSPRLFADEKLKKGPLFTISLAEWSLHRTLHKGKMTNLDFPVVAKKEFDIDAVEFVNGFFKDKAGDKKYLAQLNKRCEDHGVQRVLIMIDGEGALGAPDEKQRTKAVENHYRWVEAAKFLGCHSIRVNAQSHGKPEEQMKLVADGLRQLCEFAAKRKMGVIVENHGGLSSHGDWLVGVMKKVNLPNCGTLPDFGNFYEYDRYKGVAEMMPYAKAVSAKTYGFDNEGNETKIDYYKMMKIVLDAGYHGRVGIEWEGGKISEMEGIRLTKKLLENVREKLSQK